MKGNEILKDIEDRCGSKIENQRIRKLLILRINRLIEETDSIKASIENVLNGHSTYDPKVQRAVYKPKNH